MIVNYDTTNLGTDKDGNNLKWKVFYDDGTNVYLIASDFVRRRNFPTGMGNYVPSSNDDSYPYALSWGMNSEFYTYKNGTSQSASAGATDIFINRPVGTAYLEERGLLSFWKCRTMDNANAQSKLTACLMDTKAWSSKFVSNSVGTASNYNSDNCYAIGGPTLSMWIESWNAKHGENSQDTNKLELYYNITDVNGYCAYVKENSNVGNAICRADGYDDVLYYPHATNNLYYNCPGYYLASPTYKGNGESVKLVNNSGNIGYNSPFSTVPGGIRPIICLPSNVKISNVANEFGTYDIVNK